MKINCSVVTYKHSSEEIISLVDCILESDVNTIYIIDNSPTDDLRSIARYSPKLIYVFQNANVGYGIAHNVAIRESLKVNVDYHVVINPDILFGAGLLNDIAEVMEKNPQYGQLMPKITYKNGELQYLCRLIPTPWDYVCKRYLPFDWAKKRADRFMLKFTGYNEVMNLPILSGCFMFFRVNALKEVFLFDERFFMYPEDDDITRRMHEKYQTVYYPVLNVYHGYEAAPYKSFKMHGVLIINMIKYFNKWGWIWDKKRKETNKKVLRDLGYYSQTKY